MKNSILWFISIPLLLFPVGCAPSNANMPNKLVISRTISANESTYPSFHALTITNPNEIGDLYTIVINEGNSSNSGNTGCTEDRGINYHLDFSYNGQLVLGVNADPGGCGYAVFSTGKTIAITDNLFWSTLASDTGLSLSQLYSGG